MFLRYVSEDNCLTTFWPMMLMLESTYEFAVP
jgi:hypothetical protein